MKTKSYLLPLTLVTVLFFLWGLAHNMTDTLLAAFKHIMSMTDEQTSYIQVAFYTAYFCVALPAAFFIRRYSYKKGVLLGLALYATGGLLFYPAAHQMSYAFFLVALFILSGGLTFLETSANPFILALGAPETATRRLNIAQAFNPIGSLTGIVLSKFFILSHLNRANEAQRAHMPALQLHRIQAEELGAVMGPYIGVALFLIVFWIVFATVKMPEVSDDSKVSVRKSFSKLFANRNYLFGVLAQFFYVGAQIGVWSYTIRYVMQEVPGTDEQAAATYYLISIVLFASCRFFFAYLMRFFQPVRLLTFLAVLAIVLTFLVINVGGPVGVWSLICISGCMSLMFPTIFGVALEEVGEERKIGGSGLVMAILGGAVLTYIQGVISTRTGSINLAFYVPVLCFAVISLYGIYAARRSIEKTAV